MKRYGVINWQAEAYFNYFDQGVGKTFTVLSGCWEGGGDILCRFPEGWTTDINFCGKILHQLTFSPLSPLSSQWCDTAPQVHNACNTTIPATVVRYSIYCTLYGRGLLTWNSRIVRVMCWSAGTGLVHHKAGGYLVLLCYYHVINRTNDIQVPVIHLRLIQLLRFKKTWIKVQ